MVGALLPEGAIVVDEAITSGLGPARGDGRAPPATTGSPSPAARSATACPPRPGAAVACPDRPVWCLQADGSAMYTISALWTHAREGLDVTTVVYNNSAYAILRDGAAAGRRGGLASATGRGPARCSTSAGPGSTSSRWRAAWACPATGWTTAEGLADALRRAAAEPGPHLVEAVVPRRPLSGAAELTRPLTGVAERTFVA